MVENENTVDKKSPEYWDGHFLEDGCPSVEQAWRKKKRQTQEKIFSKLLEHIGDAGEVLGLTGWNEMGSMASFTKGNTFNADNYKPGTFLKIARDFLRPTHESDESSEKFLYLPSNFYGIVSDGKKAKYADTNVVVVFGEIEEESRPFPLYVLPNIIEAGKVAHISFDSSECLEKFSQLDIISLGGGISRPSEGASFSTGTQMVPNFGHVI